MWIYRRQDDRPNPLTKNGSHYIGGWGLAAKYFYENVDPKSTPCRPKTPL